jgi:hypothetical protein
VDPGVIQVIPPVVECLKKSMRRKARMRMKVGNYYMNWWNVGVEYKKATLR